MYFLSIWRKCIFKKSRRSCCNAHAQKLCKLDSKQAFAAMKKHAEISRMPRFCSSLGAIKQTLAGIFVRATHITLLLLLLAMAGVQARETRIVCVNNSSGAAWDIHVDFDKHTVDANAAKFSDAEISWKDSANNNYTLDRKSGALTQASPSSTGGYFLHDRCKLS
jgi:hypothetical protein